MLRLLTLVLASALATPSVASDEPLVKWIKARSGGYHTDTSARALIQDTRTCAQKYRVSEELVWKVMATESSFIPTARSRAGAKGLMQVIPKWHPEKITPKTVFWQRSNVCAGAWILREYNDRYGNMTRALRAYNGLNGHPTAYAKKVWSVKVPPLASTDFVAQANPPEVKHAIVSAPSVEASGHDWTALIAFLDAPRRALQNTQEVQPVKANLNVRTP